MNYYESTLSENTCLVLYSTVMGIEVKIPFMVPIIGLIIYKCNEVVNYTFKEISPICVLLNYKKTEFYFENPKYL